MMKVVLLLALLTVSEGDGTTVVGRTGGRVTLSCKYDIKSHGALHICWGRGQIPNSKCSNQLIATDGHKVTEGTRVSSRYQLLGRLEDGDVSLTIEDVSESDAGRYGCRVEIPGWSNDKKYHFDLVVEKAPQTTTSTTSTRETATEQTAASYTADHVTSTDHLLTSSSSSITAEGSSGVSVALVCVLVGLVFLVTAAVIFIAHRRRRLGKIPQQQVHSTVQFRSTSSGLQLQGRGSAVENIYQIDEGGDGGNGGEYEYCP